MLKQIAGAGPRMGRLDLVGESLSTFLTLIPQVIGDIGKRSAILVLVPTQFEIECLEALIGTRPEIRFAAGRSDERAASGGLSPAPRG
jgi:hypothetical protein